MHTRTTLTQLSILCSSLLLLGCADFNLRAPLGLRASTVSAADEAYQQARKLHLAQRFDEAIKSYQAALDLEQGHVNARNGLAALYAEKGDFARAIPIWRALTENANMSSGPETAYLFSNLGHAYYLSADYENAMAALEKACLLDPLNHRAWQRLGDSLHKLGQDERARQMYRQSIALREHDFRADYVATGGSASAAIDTAVKATARPDPGWGKVDVLVAPDGMLELRRTPPAPRTEAPAVTAAPAAAPVLPVLPAPGPQPLPTPPTAPVARVALLEIRNGNGVTGMARMLAMKMGDPGFKVVRLSNDKGFKVRITRVEYQPAFRADAERLAERFGSALTVEVDNLKSPDLRLVLGHDLGKEFGLRPVARPDQGATLAQAAKPGKSG